MAYTFDQVFAADPANPSNIAQNASITIFAPGDGTMTPIAITDPDGQPLGNPVAVNANGFGSAFAHATLDRVAWAGGGFTGFFTSYDGMKNEAVAARAAAETAASTAGADAAAVATAAIGTATDEASAAAASAATAATDAAASATAAANSAALVGAPADTAIAAAINGTGSTKAALNSAIAAGAADTGYDVVLLAGQSNMSGRGIPATGYLDPAHPLVFQLKGKNPNKGTVVAATDPLDMVDTPSGIGPGFQFARQYIKAGHLSYGRKILLVPTAEGGTPLTRVATPTWKPSVTGSLYSNLISQANIALALPGARLVAVLWVQGETDGDLAATGPAYQADLDALITGIRGLTGAGATTAPFIIGGMVPEYLGTGTRTAINAVHVDTPNRKTQTAFVAGPTGGELGDGNHYNRQGQIALAASMIGAFNQLTANVPGTTFRTYTTDAFSTDSTTLVGRTTDAVNGGGPAVFSASNANASFAASGGVLVRGASVTSQFAQTPVPNSRQRVTVKLTALPAGGGQVYVTARNDVVAGTNGYRLVIFDTGNVQLQKVSAGTGTNLVATYTAAVTAGQTIALDCDGTNISALVNGVALGSAIVDATFTRAGWAGIGIGSTVTSVTLDDFKIESLL